MLVYGDGVVEVVSVVCAAVPKSEAGEDGVGEDPEEVPITLS